MVGAGDDVRVDLRAVDRGGGDCVSGAEGEVR